MFRFLHISINQSFNPCVSLRASEMKGRLIGDKVHICSSSILQLPFVSRLCRRVQEQSMQPGDLADLDADMFTKCQRVREGSCGDIVCSRKPQRSEGFSVRRSFACNVSPRFVSLCTFAHHCTSLHNCILPYWPPRIMMLSGVTTMPSKMWPLL